MSPYTWLTAEAIVGYNYEYEFSGSNRGLRTDAHYYSAVSGAFPGTPTRSEDYGYHADRDYLTSADYNDGLTAENPTWTYDAAGNRASESTVTGWTYDGLNRMEASPSITYGNDILGNRTSKTGGITYSWDLLNRMTQYAVSGGATTTYKYRADGMRTFKAAAFGVDVNYRYDGQMAMEEHKTLPLLRLARRSRRFGTGSARGASTTSRRSRTIQRPFTAIRSTTGTGT